MTAPAADPRAFARERIVILTVLIVLSLAGWAVFLGEAREMGMADGTSMSSMRAMGPDLTMGGSWPLFAAMWVAMMVAMMFPAAAPMVVMYARMRRGDAASVALFTAAYMTLWFAFGLVAYAISAGVEDLASRSMWIADNWGRAGGALLVAAGIYQVTPLKNFCLRHCRTPLSFVMQHWSDGRRGAVRMGLAHGRYCMGCCWLLFLILIPLGMMNVAAMIAVAALVFAEKVLPWDRATNIAAGLVLVAGGIAVVLDPQLLPTVV